MEERELCGEIVKSGIWLYDEQFIYEVWVVRQNFEYHYEENYEDQLEQLNIDGEAFQVVLGRDGKQSGLGPAGLSLEEAVRAAEKCISTGICWTNHRLQKVFGGRRYSLLPLAIDAPPS